MHKHIEQNRDREREIEQQVLANAFSWKQFSDEMEIHTHKQIASEQATKQE